MEVSVRCQGAFHPLCEAREIHAPGYDVSFPTVSALCRDLGFSAQNLCGQLHPVGADDTADRLDEGHADNVRNDDGPPANDYGGGYPEAVLFSQLFHDSRIQSDAGVLQGD